MPDSAGGKRHSLHNRQRRSRCAVVLGGVVADANNSRPVQLLRSPQCAVRLSVDSTRNREACKRSALAVYTEDQPGAFLRAVRGLQIGDGALCTERTIL